MKNKITSVLRILTCILTVFAIIGTFGIIMADKVYTPEYLIAQAANTNTYDNAYNSLMKRFSDNYSISNIPIDVYEKSFTHEWMKKAVDEKINSTFEKRNEVIDCSASEENITEYFETYAHAEHVIKDETYENKLAESIDYAQKTALNEADVYSLDVMKRAGILNKIASYAELVRKYKYACFGGLAVLLIIMIILKRSTYWIGTALFSSGMLLLIPSVIIKTENMIQKFSLKNFTTYTLVTGTLDSLNDIVLVTGCLLLGVGILLIAVHCIFSRHKEVELQNMNGKNSQSFSI